MSIVRGINSQPVLEETSLAPAGTRAVADLFVRALQAENEPDLYQTISSWIPEVVPNERATVTFLTEDANELEILGLDGQSGLMALGQRLPVANTGPGEAISSGEPQRWMVTEFPDRAEAQKLIAAGLSHTINIPLFVAGEAIGSLNVARATAEFGDDDYHMLIDVAALISTNLERFRTVARTRAELANATSRQDRLELLANLGRRLSSAITEDDAFQIVFELTAKVLPVDKLSLALINHADGTIRVAGLSQFGMGAPALEVGSIKSYEESPIGRVLQSEAMVDIPDVGAESGSGFADLTAGGFCSSISIPIWTSGQIDAVLNCASKTLDAYSDDDRVAAEAIATLLGETLERARAQEALASRDRQLAAIVDDSPLLMMTLDSDFRIVQLSEFGASQLGYSATAFRGQPIDDLYLSSELDSLNEQLKELAANQPGAVAIWEAQMIDADGKHLWVRHTARRLAADSAPAKLIVVCEDVTEILVLTDRLEHEATHDALTGLVNRREFDRRLGEIAADTSTELPGCVCFIDVDRFKIVNDTAGHHAGDELLIELASTLSQLLQPTDIIGRLGGDEFAVLLPGCSLANAIRVGERLRQAACDLVFCWNNRTFTISLSIGVAAIEPGTDKSDEVMGRADAACYVAKNEGRNRVSIAVAAGTVDRETRPDGEWGSRLRDALENGGLRLVSQEIVAVDGGGQRRAEVLVRLVEEDGDWLPAGMFIPAAERLGLITDIDRWVIGGVVDRMVRHPEPVGGLDFVAVNLSPQSIESEEFLDDLIAMLSTSGFNPDKILFEITETAALSQFSRAVRFIETVAGIGCRFALDDFGAGFSTFHYLKRLPVDMLKIDGSLIEDLGHDAVDRSIVRSITEVAAALGMKTVAEFVEDTKTLSVLSELGVDYAQGFGVGGIQVLDGPGLLPDPT